MQSHQSVSSDDSGKKPSDVGGRIDAQKLNQPVQKHSSHTEYTWKDPCPNQKIHRNGEEIPYEYAGTSGTDRELIPSVLKTPIRPLMTATDGTKYHHPEIDPVFPGQLVWERVIPPGVFSHIAQPA